ncbi:AraC family transcriptional regulator [Streptomyces sp. NPDC058953]|uniref:helix-turn-helix transcriptional regulator n=1 Tax=unclassified Streptomyces TaxID=2593676 RepID=UPI0036A74770
MTGGEGEGEGEGKGEGGRTARGTAGREWARHWRHEALPGLDLLRARYVSHRFPRHSHEGYLLAAVLRGAEDLGIPGGRFLIRPGDIAVLNPEVPHEARTGDPEGWAYVALYPSLALVGAVADEIGALRGTPAFRDAAVADPVASALLHRVYEAADAGDALAADSLLRTAIARLLRANGGPMPLRAPRAAGAGAVARARELLEERMTDPPSLERLAREVGTAPFALLRAFRAAYGMPPHTWLTDARVRRAQRLLALGERPAEVAAAVGFTDQPHLNRHFTRIVGVPPGAYRKERAG